MSFENKIFEGIYYSRFIASWTNIRGKVTPEIKVWLRTLTVNKKRIPEDVIQEIYGLGCDGKFELEEHLKRFSKACGHK
jgi:hypothetical protein